MFISERIQAVIHALEVGGSRRLNYVALVVAVLSLAVWYDLHCYRNFSSPEAMDAAQVARNLSDGKGFTTEFIRPFSLYLLQKHNHAQAALLASGTNAANAAQLNGWHPDLANAPLYPLVLAGLWKIHQPNWNATSGNAYSVTENGKLETVGNFWCPGGKFARYKPEFYIAVFNQILFLAAVLLTFLVTKTIFDAPAAWLAAMLMLGSDTLWKFSVSGLPTMLLLVIFLGLVWCLASFETLGRDQNPVERRRFILAVVAGFLTGLGMLTRYSFGWVILPVIVFFIMFGGARRTGLALATVLIFIAIVSPWIARNLAVSGTFFGTAGYAVVEGTMGFPGTRLMQSSNPEMTAAYWVLPYLVKFETNLRDLLQDDLMRLAGGWLGILFLAGLLLGLRNTVARRLRHFTVMCLGIFLVVSALGRTQLSTISPEINTENLFVLLTPLVIIFGVAFFLTLLNQMNTPLLAVRYAVVGFVVLLGCQPFIMTLLPPKMSPSAFPPYFPPDIQRFAKWIEPNELMMSDIPWAVAWYGDRECSWTTINSRYEYSLINDYIKHISAIYLTRDTLDARLFSECFQGGADSWSSFVFERIAVDKIKTPNAADTWGRVIFRNAPGQNANFPLQVAPSDIHSGLFLTDRQRWQTE